MFLRKNKPLTVRVFRNYKSRDDIRQKTGEKTGKKCHENVKKSQNRGVQFKIFPHAADNAEKYFIVPASEKFSDFFFFHNFDNFKNFQ